MEGLAVHVRGLRAPADQVHLDRRFVLVPACLVAELCRREVGVQLAVDAMQEVEVELGGDAFAVVVGGQQDVELLAQVDADDGGALPAGMAPHLPQEGRGLGGVEIADGGAGEEADAAGPGQLVRQIEVGGEVGNDGLHLQTRETPADARRGQVEEVAGDVDRQVQVRRVQRAEQDLGLDAGAGAVFEQAGAGPAELRQLRGVPAQDRRLGARGVVLLQRGDALEQLGAAVVVEPAARQGLARGREAGDDVIAERFALAGSIVDCIEHFKDPPPGAVQRTATGHPGGRNCGSWRARGRRA